MAKTRKPGAVRKRRGKVVGMRARRVGAPGRPTGNSQPKPEPARFDVRALDHLKKCGRGTTVRVLYRVDEHSTGVARTHLVFYDRHGWYCEHGRDCPAVPHAQREARKFGFTGAAPAAPTHGSTHNGRMRA